MDAKRSLAHNWLLEPTKEEYKEAFKAASRFYEFVCSLLPPELSAPKKK